MGVSDDPSLAKAVDAEVIEGRRLVHEVAEMSEYLQRAWKWRQRRRWAVAILVGILLVATFIAGLLAFQTEDDRNPDPPSALPSGVAVYDIAGDDVPEFVKIDGEILPVTSPSDDAWWVPFLPFLGVVLAALLTGGASLLSDRRRGELEDRMGRIEAIVKSSATAEPAQVTSGADKQAHGP